MAEASGLRSAGCRGAGDCVLDALVSIVAFGAGRCVGSAASSRWETEADVTDCVSDPCTDAFSVDAVVACCCGVITAWASTCAVCVDPFSVDAFQYHRPPETRSSAAPKNHGHGFRLLRSASISALADCQSASWYGKSRSASLRRASSSNSSLVFMAIRSLGPWCPPVGQWPVAALGGRGIHATWTCLR